MKKNNLENLDKKHPFKVPNTYFEDLAERIHQRILDNSLEDNHKHNFDDNLLKNFDKKAPFGTPEGYFEGFSEKLNAKISQQNKQQKTKIYTPKSLFAKLHIYTKSLTVAAAVVLLGGFAYVIYENNQLKNSDNTEKLLAANVVPADISNNEIVEYIQENHTENNENEVLEHITETHITETHLQEISNTKEILKEIPKENLQEILQEKSQENQKKNNIINVLPNDLPKEELQEMLNNGELEEEILD